MKLPNWFRIVWWILLLLCITVILVLRLGDYKEGEFYPFDILLLIFWIILMLSPIFYSIEIFGIKLQQEIRELKSNLDFKFTEIKNDLRLSQSQNLTANIYPPPPTDDMISEKKSLFKQFAKEVSAKEVETTMQEDINRVPEENVNLFQVRFLLEQEIDRIWKLKLSKGGTTLQSQRTLMRQLGELNELGTIPENVNTIIRDILGICNYGIHGKNVTNEQYKFVLDFSSGIIDFLKRIQ